MLFTEMFKNQFIYKYDTIIISIERERNTIAVKLIDMFNTLNHYVYFTKDNYMYIPTKTFPKPKDSTIGNAKKVLENILRNKVNDIEFNFILKANEQFKSHEFESSIIYEIKLRNNNEI